MGWLTFIASLIDSLAWPSGAVIIAALFRKPITRILRSVRKLKYHDLEVDVEKELDELKAEAAKELGPPTQLALPEASSAPEGEGAPMLFIDQVEAVARVAPEAAIAFAWSAVEKELMAAVLRTASSPDSPAYNSPLKNLQLLTEQDYLPKSFANLIDELRRFRNKVAHAHPSHQSDVTPDAAIEYGVLAGQARGRLRLINR